MITGLHAIIYTRDAEADRAFLRPPSVDAGEGWLIFAAPPAELAFRPAETNGKHEPHLMCDDVEAELVRRREQRIECGPVSDQGWCLLTAIRLPGGSELGLYQPRHATAHAAAPQ